MEETKFCVEDWLGYLFFVNIHSTKKELGFDLLFALLDEKKFGSSTAAA